MSSIPKKSCDKKKTPKSVGSDKTPFLFWYVNKSGLGWFGLGIVHSIHMDSFFPWKLVNQSAFGEENKTGQYTGGRGGGKGLKIHLPPHPSPLPNPLIQRLRSSNRNIFSPSRIVRKTTSHPPPTKKTPQKSPPIHALPPPHPLAFLQLHHPP